MDSVNQPQRRATLQGYLARYEHDDSASVPVELPRYATVERFGDDDYDRAGFWYSFGDEPEEILAACLADYEDSGYEPFLLVDLDSGKEHEVSGFALV